MVATTKTRKLSRKAAATPAPAGKEPLQVRIPVTVKRAFKSAAALRGMEPNELFVEVWDHCERTLRTAPSGGGKGGKRRTKAKPPLTFSRRSGKSGSRRSWRTR